MGSAWSRRPTGGEDDGEPIRFGAGPTVAGLNAEEWGLVRNAPDYDAEEMASVRPSAAGAPSETGPAELGNQNSLQAFTHFPLAKEEAGSEVGPVVPWDASWTPEPQYLAPNTPPPDPVWAPPNRVEPPAGYRVPSPVPDAAPPVAAATPVTSGGSSAAGPASGRQLFPEERTLALMAEDLIGRPLQERVADARHRAEAAVDVGADNCKLPIENSQLTIDNRADTHDLWDQVMPLLAETAEGAAVPAAEQGVRPSREAPRGSATAAGGAGEAGKADLLDRALVAGERAGLRIASG